MIEKGAAKQIAQQYVKSMALAAEIPLAIYNNRTIECDFGWVFFYGAKNTEFVMAGNAPIIIDRENGSVHLTGTAFPISRYIESYARVRRAFPFATEEYLVVLFGWRPGVEKISLTKAIRLATGKGLADAKACTDDLLNGSSVTVSFQAEAKAEAFCEEVQSLGVYARREKRFV